MPIETSVPIQHFSQRAFGAIAYEVVGHAFEVHRTLGRAFDESPYQSTLAHILDRRAHEGVCIRLMHGDFVKRYFIDLLVDGGCPFELKVASELHARHRKQLIEYLMMTDLSHGKLLNFGAEAFQHEFVNCHETTEHRRRFELNADRWHTRDRRANQFQEIVVEILRDWGSGLDGGLYTEAATHFLGGVDEIRRNVDTLWEGNPVGKQVCNLLNWNEAFKITTFRRNLQVFENRLRQFLKNTTLRKIYWVNVVSGEVRFVVIE